MLLDADAFELAEKCIASLFAHAREELALTLMTCNAMDKARALATMVRIANPRAHLWAVIDQAEADAHAEIRFDHYPHLRDFRQGHPCWRKLTDPLLFAEPDGEIILLDPALYFPNHFSFEPTTERGLLLMWHPRPCLLPDSVVRRAFELRVPLAHHVGMGVVQFRNRIDLVWLDAFIGQLGGATLPGQRWLESVVWSALAMRMGGGYLDPLHWQCWHHRHWKRFVLRLGASGPGLLGMQDLSRAKGFHLTGVAQRWLAPACEQRVFPAPGQVDQPGEIRAFEPLSPAHYVIDLNLKRLARSLGYHAIFSPAT